MKLRGRNGRRRLHHQVASFLGFWERDHVANVVGARQQHHRAVEAHGDAAVWRGAEAQRAQQEGFGLVALVVRQREDFAVAQLAFERRVPRRAG